MHCYPSEDSKFSFKVIINVNLKEFEKSSEENKL